MSKLSNRLMKTSPIVISLVSFVLASLVSCVIMLLCGYDPIFAYSVIIEGSLGSVRSLTNTLIQATPLIFTGLAFMVGKKATLINLGVEGQMYTGAMVAALVGMTPLPLPGILHLLLALVCGVIGGGLAGTMTNFIIINFCDYLVNYPLKAEGAVAQTNKIVDGALLGKMIPGYQLTWAIVIAVLAALIVKFVLEKTRFGYEVRAVGLNMKAAETAGIKVGGVMMKAMLFSGALAGLCGAVHVTSVGKRFISGFSPGYGFSGISVAALASDSPLGIILAGIIFGALKTGAMYLNMMSQIPTEFVSVIQALVVIFVSAPLLIRALIGADRKPKKGGRSHAE